MMFLFLLLIGSALSSFNCSSCVFTESNTLFPYELASNCQRCFPYNKTIADHTIVNLLKAMELYAFEDIAVNPPAPFVVVDLRKQLTKIQQTTYDTDFDFQEEIRNVFAALGDAHTNYYAPVPQQFTFYQPLNMFSYTDDNGKLTLEVANITADIVANYYENKTSLDQYYGAKVVSIDGADPIDVVKEFALKYVGITKEDQTKFNIALLQRTPRTVFGNHWLGLFTWRPHHFITTPKNSTISYQLLLTNGTNIEVEFSWLAQPNQVFNSSEDYINSYYASSSSSSKKDERKEREKRYTVVEESVVDGLGFYQLDNRTLVWYQNNFEPKDYYSYFKTVFLQNKQTTTATTTTTTNFLFFFFLSSSKVFDGLLFAKYKGLDQLILDMSMNGGGDICLGRAMLNLLFPESQFNHSLNYGSTDLPSSDLALNLTQTAIKYGLNETEWSPQFYQSPLDGKVFDDISWISPGIQRERGGLIRNYSQLVYINKAIENVLAGCGTSSFEFKKPVFTPSKTVILSRGFCGSTCALFVDSLHDYVDVKTVVLGGYNTSKPMAYRSFPGLQVLDSAGFYDTLDLLKQDTSDQSCTSCSAPRRLLTSAAFRLCIREIYKNDTDTTFPLEYTFQPGDYHFELTKESQIDPTLTWNLVASKVLDNEDAWRK